MVVALAINRMSGCVPEGEIGNARQGAEKTSVFPGAERLCDLTQPVIRIYRRGAHNPRAFCHRRRQNSHRRPASPPAGHLKAPTTSIAFNNPIVAAPRRYRPFGGVTAFSLCRASPLQGSRLRRRNLSSHVSGANPAMSWIASTWAGRRSACNRYAGIGQNEPFFPRHVRRYPALSAQQESACLPPNRRDPETKVNSLRVGLWGSVGRDERRRNFGNGATRHCPGGRGAA